MSNPQAPIFVSKLVTLVARFAVMAAIWIGFMPSLSQAADTFANTGPLATARQNHTATLLANGKVLVAGGYNYGALASAELFDVGLGYSDASRPIIGSASFDASGKLVLAGTGFSGISSASGGNGTQDSASNSPVVQLRRLDNEQTTFLSSDATTNTSATAFTSVPITPFSGYALATVFTNGIPSASSFVSFFTTLPPPDIVVEQPAGTGIASGGTQAFVTPCGTPVSLTFTIDNPASAGADNLTGLTITQDGSNAADFAVTANPTTPVAPAGTTTFTVRFFPAAGSATTLYETAAIHIASNVAAKKTYNINLSGTALSYTQSTTNDGMSDAAKFLMAPLGFNWQTNQAALVNNYYTNANAANLYSQAQVQALNVATPLLT